MGDAKKQSIHFENMYTPVQLCTADGTILPDTNIPWQTESQKL
jgi:hypothetical protein